VHFLCLFCGPESVVFDDFCAQKALYYVVLRFPRCGEFQAVLSVIGKLRLRTRGRRSRARWRLAPVAGLLNLLLKTIILICAQDEVKEKQSKIAVSSRHNRKREIAGLLKLLLKTVMLICSQDEGKEKQSKIAVSSGHNRKREIAGLLKLLLKTVMLICAQDEGKEKQSKIAVSSRHNRKREIAGLLKLLLKKASHSKCTG
jgi:hypothetical protein